MFYLTVYMSVCLSVCMSVGLLSLSLAVVDRFHLASSAGGRTVHLSSRLSFVMDKVGRGGGKREDRTGIERGWTIQAVAEVDGSRRRRRGY
jgi:hypothetical protein